jgi:hypothetical protein
VKLVERVFEALKELPTHPNGVRVSCGAIKFRPLSLQPHEPLIVPRLSLALASAFISMLF